MSAANAFSRSQRIIVGAVGAALLAYTHFNLDTAKESNQLFQETLSRNEKTRKELRSMAMQLSQPFTNIFQSLQPEMESLEVRAEPIMQYLNQQKEEKRRAQLDKEESIPQ